MEAVKVFTEMGFMDLHLPNSKKELTLGQHIELSKINLDIQALNQELEECKFRLEIEDVLEDDDEIIYDETYFNADKALINRKLQEQYEKILRAVVSSDEDFIIDIIPHKLLKEVAEHITVEKEFGILYKFDFPQAMQPDIEELEQEKENIINFYARQNIKLKEAGEEPLKITLEDSKRIDKIEQDIELCRKGTFILIPAERILFETRIRLDTLNKTLPSLTQDVKDNIENSGLTLEEYLKTLISWEELETRKDMEERLALEGKLKQYLHEHQAGVYERSADIIAHICIPEGQKYSMTKAQKRVPYFKELDLATVDSILGFFLKLREHLTLDTAISLMIQENPELKKHANI